MIEKYILEQQPELQERLRQVWKCISEAIPDAEQTICYSMPTFKKQKNIIHFAAFKNHIGIYPGPKTIEAFQDRLSAYKTSKGAIQIPHTEALPLELIADLARWSYENNGAKKKGKCQ